ncbi:GIY-YIG nuclease family protein [Sphingobium abikonense]|uniref:GIY-YIG nuclease family protein n=1 Tax=Sphingobium abikonense TaxID=86193 RepID=UPI0007888DBB|nr:GIY-YIG nuclease family protein [Sphingobium abikonense]
MTFWTYMLHCADRSFYVGHTDSLETRISQHDHGTLPGYTQTRLPVKLVWSQAFGTRMEALEAERQIKGWSRAKKLALIRNDWTLISALARSNMEK